MQPVVALTNGTRAPWYSHHCPCWLGSWTIGGSEWRIHRVCPCDRHVQLYLSGTELTGTLSASAATVTLIFPAGSGLTVNLIDGKTHAQINIDYRWIIEEDRTFYVDPTKTTE